MWSKIGDQNCVRMSLIFPVQSGIYLTCCRQIVSETNQGTAIFAYTRTLDVLRFNLPPSAYKNHYEKRVNLALKCKELKLYTTSLKYMAYRLYIEHIVIIQFINWDLNITSKCTLNCQECGPKKKSNLATENYCSLSIIATIQEWEHLGTYAIFREFHLHWMYITCLL